NILRSWPNDIQIHHAFDQSRQLACDLAEFLGMLTPDIVPINSLRPYILIGPNDGEVSGSDNHDECMQDSDENFSNLDLSQIIGYAAKEVNLIRQKENEREKVNINKDSQNLSLNECQKQLSFIDIDETLDSSIINTDINNTDTTILVTENVIDFQEMVYQREKHNAYNSRNIERTIKTNSTKLCKSDFVLVVFGLQLCIGQVISSFYEAYGYHSYHQEPITDIENISYITLKVFTPIRNIFSALTEEGCFLITHQHPKNVIYHLNMQDIKVFDDNTLQLLNKAKIHYNFFNQKEVIQIIAQNL
ncbi:11340_t:CDS:2, partial [Rhizophagus irregularis]